LLKRRKRRDKLKKPLQLRQRPKDKLKRTVLLKQKLRLNV